ncbi:hypothetical protein QR98_0024060 [Sarcoptes scabiei]|nr:hypothetical protein QR98_0024060 [Sarcoptes scabiei]
MTVAEKNRCEQYISIFENDSTDLQYDYCENLFDGRGYTSGRAGFCTGTTDSLQVIQLFTSYQSKNLLAKFLPELERLAKHFSGDVSKLSGYCKAWKESAKSPLFRQCQDYISDLLYYGPAMKEALRIGLTTALGKCAFYDTIIQHGGGIDPDSFGAIVKKTEKVMNDKMDPNEYDWLLRFLMERKKTLQNPHNKATASHWRDSVDRVNAMIGLLNQTNWFLTTPIHIKTRYHNLIIK